MSPKDFFDRDLKTNIFAKRTTASILSKGRNPYGKTERHRRLQYPRNYWHN